MFVAIILHFDNSHLASRLDAGLVLFLHVGKLKLFSEILLLTLFKIFKVMRGTPGIPHMPFPKHGLSHTLAMHKERKGNRQSVPIYTAWKYGLNYTSWWSSGKGQGEKLLDLRFVLQGSGRVS